MSVQNSSRTNGNSQTLMILSCERDDLLQQHEQLEAAGFISSRSDVTPRVGEILRENSSQTIQGAFEARAKEQMTFYCKNRRAEMTLSAVPAKPFKRPTKPAEARQNVFEPGQMPVAATKLAEGVTRVQLTLRRWRC